MNKQKSQLGFAHIMIVVIVLSVALVGTLGFVFWQNFMQPKESASISDTKASNKSDNKTPVQTVKYKTYTDSVYNASFQYPEEWSVGSLTVEPSDDPHYNRSVDVKNEKGEIIANLILGLSGLGGTCVDNNGNPQTTKFTVLDSAPVAVKSKKSVSFSFVLGPSDSSYGGNGYSAAYGLTDTYTHNGDYQVCLFYNLFESSIVNTYGTNGYNISFGNSYTNTKYFSSLDDANKYIASNEYKAIKKMIMSLTY